MRLHLSNIIIGFLVWIIGFLVWEIWIVYGQNTPPINPIVPTAVTQPWPTPSLPPAPAPEEFCKWGIKLNTEFPFIGKCLKISKDSSVAYTTGIEWGYQVLTVNESSIFQVLLTALSKIVMSLILLSCFVLIIRAWFEAIMWWGRASAKNKIYSVIAALALLGTASVILKIVNPNFFGDSAPITQPVTQPASNGLVWDWGNPNPNAPDTLDG
jgi:hypothetical protein